MSSKNLFFIATILLVICLHVISSLATYPISDPWIVTNIAGKRKHPGTKVTLKIRSPSKKTVSIYIQQRKTNFNQTLATNVKLCAGYNEVKVAIPLFGDFVKPSPQNYFAVFENGVRVDYSATFKIGHPDFGITINRPVAGDVIKVGHELKASWKGNFLPPGADPSTFRLVRCLFEPAKLQSPNAIFSSKNFVNGVDFDFATGSLVYKLPLDTIPNTLYKFGCLAVNSAVTPNEFHIYSAGTFLVTK
ncbi:hypothetical protein Glove_151g149 [Diversispora epigaea]|uniref:Uncharacterized protein n=1 Tax=Diversispora epigaea TaxID=1348612 RepID=A0A397J1X4_9GLOM|nr:hypothetical protein Glove_151g149 [Diversispora epigaea]